jgi:bis(5'-nucleosidyl)-tetraphosphatase
VRLGVNPELGFPEHHEARWLAAKEALALLNPRVSEALHWALGRMHRG